MNEARIRELFEQALGKPPEERARFLDRVAETGSSLRARVEALLQAHEERSGFLADAAETVEEPGAVIGHYKLLQKIGEGGMGTVWMAEQFEPVRRKVAFKIIKLGMDTKQVVVRFEAERQALALMDHPSIAKVLDAGATGNGRPYFVMELVRGVPITEFCDQAKLGLRERLALFSDVCLAVQHAHQKGIIHRDLKPSNVLVTLHDGTPVPKVIDFGIAKATNAELTQKTLFTEFQQVLGTPEYMSPEQAAMSGLDIDTRADVYSLGVLLYELLTGTKPFDLKTALSRGYEELLRTIREEDPPKPSTRASTTGADSGTISLARRLAEGQLGRMLRGDLDWIVLRAMDKDRTRRYETANGLALDVRRYLDGEPVVAAPPSRVYRLRKFVTRNKAAVATGMVILLVLLGGILGTSLGMVRAQRETRRADREKRRAEEEKAVAVSARKKSEVVADFLGETLSNVAPGVALGRDTTMLREIMDAAAARIEAGELKDLPEAELQLRFSIGATYLDLNAYEPAERMLEPALALARTLPRPDPRAVVIARLNLGTVWGAMAKFEQAEPLLRAALEGAERLSPSDPALRAQTTQQLGSCLRQQGKYVDALPTLERAVALQRILGEGWKLAAVLKDLGMVHLAMGELEQAEPFVREAAAMAKRLAPDGRPVTVACLVTLGALCKDKSDLEGAEQAFTDAVAMARRISEGDASGLARSITFQASIQVRRKKFEEARKGFEEALAMRRRLHGGDEHGDVAESLQNLGLLQLDRQEYDAAEQNLAESVAIYRRTLRGGDHPMLAHSLKGVGTARWRKGDLAGAEAAMSECIAMLRRLHEEPHFQLADTLKRLAGIHEQREDLAACEPLLRESVEMHAALNPGNHALHGEGWAELAEISRNLGRPKVALADVEKSIAALRSAYPNGSLLLARMLHSRGLVLAGLREFDGAAGSFAESAAMLERLGAEHDSDRVTVLDARGHVLFVAGRLEEADACLQVALPVARRVLGDDHGRVADLLTALSEANLVAGRPETAETYCVDELAMRRRLGQPPDALASPLMRLALMRLAAGRLEEAEVLARESAAIRGNSYPDGHPNVWLRHNTNSVLGEVLMRQGRLDEAEPLLVASWHALEKAENVPPPWQGIDRKREALVRVVEMFSARAQADDEYSAQAAEWRKRLEAWDAARK